MVVNEFAECVSVGTAAELLNEIRGAVSDIIHLETELSAGQLERKLCEIFNKMAEGLDFSGATFMCSLLREYFNRVFASILQEFTDRSWLREVDLSDAVNVAVRTHFPEQAIADLDLKLFNFEVLQAHDLAFEQQRFCLFLRIVLSEFIADEGVKKVAYVAFETAWRKCTTEMFDGISAGRPVPSVESFVQDWIPRSIHSFKCDDMEFETALDILHALVELGTLPFRLVYENGRPPPENWHFIESVLSACWPHSSEESADAEPANRSVGSKPSLKCGPGLRVLVDAKFKKPAYHRVVVSNSSAAAQPATRSSSSPMSRPSRPSRRSPLKLTPRPKGSIRALLASKMSGASAIRTTPLSRLEPR